MYILNRYDITGTEPHAAVGIVENVNPDVITGGSGNSNADSAVTPIVMEAVFGEQIISKLVSIFIPANGLVNDVNYITVDQTNLGINGLRAIRAAALLGLYDRFSVEQTAAGATPSFIGMWDKTVDHVNSLCVVNGTLILRIPKQQEDLFADKDVQIQIWYNNKP